MAWQRRSIGDSCQSGNMVALLNSLCFVFKISVLPKYRVKYYDYIAMLCSGIYNVIVMLALMLALAPYD